MKYICFYDKDDAEKRRYVLAATNKIDYIISALTKVSLDSIELISASPTQDKRVYAGRKEKVSERVFLKLFMTFGKRNIFTKILDYVSIPLQLFFYLLFHTTRNENVIVYHSLAYRIPVSLAKKIRHFRLILEVEEIYADVSGNKKQRKKEIIFSKQADGFIFPTQLLDKEINLKHKLSAIIHGTYQVEADRKCKEEICESHNMNPKDIHCVYAGTFDPRKGGGIAAAAAEFLPENYHIHILGFGSEKQIQEMQERIADISLRAKARVTYDGLLSGEEYIRFIQSCDIGLSTQNPDAAFNATSFPSKILSYLANGLRVVSIRIPAIEQSAVGNALYYYDTQTPEEIAKAILSIDMTQKYDSRRLVAQLSEKFKMELNALVDRC